MTNSIEEMLRENAEARESVPGSKPAKSHWDSVETYCLSHGHLPSNTAAPCRHCYDESVERAFVVQDLWRRLALSDAVIEELATKTKAFADAFSGNGDEMVADAFTIAKAKISK